MKRCVSTYALLSLRTEIANDFVGCGATGNNCSAGYFLELFLSSSLFDVIGYWVTDSFLRTMYDG